ncbi:hypothetical protein A2U01_0083837, partial [Trifolium medium]|nr:hypothetical protein [Trifolium medium]
DYAFIGVYILTQNAVITEEARIYRVLPPDNMKLNTRELCPIPCLSLERMEVPCTIITRATKHGNFFVHFSVPVQAST